MRWSIILIILVMLPGISTTTYADDDVFGIKVEQRALDLLTLLAQRMAEVRSSTDLEQVISIKTKIIIGEVIETDQVIGPLPGEVIQQLPEIIIQLRIEIFRSGPDLVRVNLTGNFGELQFLVSESESLASLPEEGVFAEMNIPQMLPSELMLKDDGGLFTLINLMGGLPFGSLLSQVSGGGGGDPDVTFGEVDSSDMRATVRYWGRDRTAAGIAHVINILTTGAAPYHQSIRMWVLEDTLELYQFSIEDIRGTQIFIFVEELNTAPVLSEADFTLDLADMVEVSEDEFVQTVALKVITSPVVEGPIAVDMTASSHEVNRTGTVVISTNGFDMQDKENELGVEMEHRGPGGSWEPLAVTEYAGLVPLGHWNANFMPGENTELGMYSFRVRYINISGNISEWLEILDMVTVMPAPPRVVRTIPIKNDFGVLVSTPISVTFSKPMDKASVEANFSVTKWNMKLQGLFTWDENTLIFSPTDALRYDTSYLVMITGEAKDTDGIGLDGNFDTRSDGTPYDDYYWSFRTTPASPALALESKISPVSVIKGDWFSLRVMAKHVTDMEKFSFSLVFDPEVLDIKKVDVTSFSSWRPRPRHIDAVDICGKPEVDNSTGSVTMACDSTRAGGVSGSGAIATISFHAIGAGAASFEFQEASMVNSEGKAIDIELDTPEIQVAEFHPLDVNHDGVVNILDSVAMALENTQAAPHLAQTKLEQNFPNPFNPETWIPYQLAQPSHVIVRIHSSKGELIRTLDLGVKEAGLYTDRMKAAYWNGTDDTGQKVSSGVYFYTIQAGRFTATRKMLSSQ